MAEFGEKQRYTECQRATQAEQVGKGADESLLVPGYQKNSQPQREWQPVAQQP